MNTSLVMTVSFSGLALLFSLPALPERRSDQRALVHIVRDLFAG